MTIASELKRGSEVFGKHPRQSETAFPEPLLDPDQASPILGVHPKTMQKMARCGDIGGIRGDKLWRFRASEIESWIQGQLASGNWMIEPFDLSGHVRLLPLTTLR